MASFLDFVKQKYIWFIVGAVVFYVSFILISDANEIFEKFLEIRLEFLFLIFSIGFLSHFVKSIRQKILLSNIAGSKNIIIHV